MLSVLSPVSWRTSDLDSLKRNWRLLAEKFPNIIATKEVPELLTEVTTLKIERETPTELPVDEFFSALNKKVDEDGDPIYPVLIKLGSALSTIYNSSSPAERDFSLMNLIAGDPIKNKTSQLLLLTKMFITAEIRSLARNCKKCLEKEKGEKTSHCHCDLWIPPEDLLVTMRDGKPSQRYKRDLEEKKIEDDSLKVLKEMQAADDLVDKESEMRREVKKFTKSMKAKEVRNIEAEEKKRAKDVKGKADRKAKEKGPQRKVESESKKKKEEKKRRLK